MKVEIVGDSVLFSAESEADYYAIHRIRVFGVESMHMRDTDAGGFGPALRGPLEFKLNRRDIAPSEMLMLPGGEAPGNYKRVRVVDGMCADVLGETRARLECCRAAVLADQAQLASCPLASERLSALSSLASLRAKQIEDQMRSSRELGQAAN